MSLSEIGKPADKAKEVLQEGRERVGNQIGGGLGSDIKYGTKITPDKFTKMPESDIDNLSKSQVRSLSGDDLNTLASSSDQTKFDRLIEKHGDKLSGKQIRDLNPDTLDKMIDKHPLSEWAERQAASLTKDQAVDLAQKGKLSELEAPQLAKALNYTTDEQGKLQPRSKDDKGEIVWSMERDILNLNENKLQALGDNVQYLSPQQLGALAKDGRLNDLGDTVRHLDQNQLGMLARNGNFAQLDAKYIDQALSSNRSDIGQKQIIREMKSTVNKLSADQLQALGENVQHLSLDQLGALAKDGRLNDLGDTVHHLDQNQLGMIAFNGNFAQLDAKYIDQALNHNTTGIDQKQIILRMEKIEDFDSDQLQALKGNVEYLDQAQLQALGNKINYLDSDQLKALRDNIRYLEQDKIEFLAQNGRFSDLTSTQIKDVLTSSKDETGLESDRPAQQREAIIQAMGDHVVKLDGERLRALKDNVQYIKSGRLSDLADANKLAEFDASQIRQALDGDMVNNPRGEAEKGAIIRAMADAGVQQLDGAQLRTLDTDIKYLTDTQLKSLGDNVLYLKQDQLETLATAGKFHKLNAGQIDQVLKYTKDSYGVQTIRNPAEQKAIIREIGSDITNFQPGQLQDLGDSVSYLDKTQLQALDKDIVHLTEMQMKQLGDNVQYLQQDQLVTLAKKGRFSDFKAGQLDKALHGNDQASINAKEIVENIKDIEELRGFQLNELKNDVQYLQQDQLEALARAGKFSEFDPGQLEKALSNPALTADDKKAIVHNIANIEKLREDQLRDLGTNVEHLDQKQLMALAKAGMFKEFTEGTSGASGKPGQLEKALSNPALKDDDKRNIVWNIKGIENLSNQHLKDMGKNLQYLTRSQGDAILDSRKKVAEKEALIKDLGPDIQHLHADRIEQLFTSLPATATDKERATLVHALGTDVKSLKPEQITKLGDNVQYLQQSQLEALASAGKFHELDTKQITLALDKNANGSIDKKAVIENITDKDAGELSNAQLKKLGQNLEHLKDTQMDAILDSRKKVAEKEALIKDLGPDIQHLHADRIEQLFTSLPATATDKERATLVHALGKNIGTLKGDQLRKLGDKNATFLTSDQLKTLTNNGRFADLSAKQIDNALNHNIDPKLDKQAVVQGIKEIEKLDKDRIQALGDDTARMFTNTQLKDLATNGRFADLSAKQIDNSLNHNSDPKLDKKVIVQGITEIEKLDKSQLQALGDAKLTNNQLDWLTKEAGGARKIEQFGKKQMAGLTPEHIEYLKKTIDGQAALDNFKRDQISGLQEGAFKKYVEYREIGSWSKEQRAGLTREQMGWLDKKQLTSLSSAQMGEFTRQQLRGIRPEQMQLLGDEQLQGLTGAQIKEMTPQQIAGLTPDQLGKLNITDQIPSLRAAHLSVLSEAQLHGLSADQVGALTSVQWKGISAQQIKWLRPDQVTEITPERLTRLTEPQIKAFTRDQRKAIDSEQREAIKETKAKFKQAPKGGVGGPIDWGGGFDMPDLPPPPMLDPRYADLFKPREMAAEDRQALNNINTDASLTPEDKKAAKAAFMREWEVLGRDARAGAMKEYEMRLDVHNKIKVAQFNAAQKFAEMKEEQRFKQKVANQQIRMMLFNVVFGGVKSSARGLMDLTR